MKISFFCIGMVFCVFGLMLIGCDLFGKDENELPENIIFFEANELNTTTSLIGVPENPIGSIWGPGSNDIVIGGGLNYSTQPGIGWSQQFGGIFVTSFSITGNNSHFLTTTENRRILVIVPDGCIIEVWDLETLKVIATNISNPGYSVSFIALPNRRYGGFAWYQNNAQGNLELRAIYHNR